MKAETKRNNTKFRLLLLSVFVISFLIFLATSAGDTPYNYFTRLADAFIHGRLYLTSAPSWLSELVPIATDKFYVVQPPMPALMAIPFVAMFGIGFPQQILAHFTGALITVLVCALAYTLKKEFKFAIFGAVLGGVGTIMWYEAATGSVWYLGQLVAVSGLLVALLEGFTKKRPVVMGLGLGIAYLSRIHTILAFPIFIYILYQEYSFKTLVTAVKKFQLAKLVPLLKFSLGVFPFLAFNAVYNFIRFGTPLDKGYFLIPGIYEEPWFSKGMLNAQYIPDHLSLLFLKLPIFLDKYPYIIPSWYGLAIWITTPLFVMTLFASIKSRLVQVAWLSSLLIFIVVALRGGTGWTQFGYRYAVDFYPFLILLTLLGVKKNGLKKYHWILLFIGVVVNLWGVLWINKFGWVRF